MASTYTNNLGIQKPANGEQSGTWGDTVNANSDILDIGVNGVLSLTLSGASSTLTTSDGVVSSGQYKMLLLTGSPSATHTITISPNDAQKIYYVYNSTTSNVVFSQGSGSSYTVAAGESAILYANGAGATGAVAKFDAGALIRATAQTTTSGTAINFTGIPAGVKRLTVMFSGVSTTSTSGILIRLGTSGGVESTGYVSGVSRGTTITRDTTGFVVQVPVSQADLFSGAVVITGIGGNTFVDAGNTVDNSTNAVQVAAGTKTLSGTLDRVQITTISGFSTFDAGTINIMYET